MDKHRLPLLAQRVVSLRRRIWSLSGHSGYPAPDTLCRARQSRLQFGAAQSELDANQIEVRFDREEHIRVLHRNREQWTALSTLARSASSAATSVPGTSRCLHGGGDSKQIGQACLPALLSLTVCLGGVH